jgi:hypothetical protein
VPKNGCKNDSRGKVHSDYSTIGEVCLAARAEIYSRCAARVQKQYAPLSNLLSTTNLLFKFTLESSINTVIVIAEIVGRALVLRNRISYKNRSRDPHLPYPEMGIQGNWPRFKSTSNYAMRTCRAATTQSSN